MLSRLTTLGVTAALTLGTAAAVSTPASAAAPTTAHSAASDQHAACAATPGASARQLLCQSIATPGIRPLTVSASPAGIPAGYGYSPTQLRTAYSVPGSATTTTVAIVDAYGYPNVLNDLKTYRAQAGIPQTLSIRVVNQAGGSKLPAAGPSNWKYETALDVDMVSAICPSCHILLVQTNDDDRSGRADLEAGVQSAVRLGARFVSMSWGRSESSGDGHSNAIFAHPGVAFVASAGDDGYGTLWPATSPEVTAVGGTKLLLDGSNHRTSETVWNELASGYGATSSGCSRYAGKPVWQGVVPSSVCRNKGVADVSMDADPLTGMAIYSGGWLKYGGTSAAAPMVTALYALAGTPRAGSYPAYYPYGNHSSANFYDVTSGATAACSPAPLCRAGVGWDGPTGLGAPIGVGGFRAPPASTITLRNPGNRSNWAGTRVGAALAPTDSRHLPVYWSVTHIPYGLTFHSNGTFTGVVTTGGRYTVSAVGRDVNGGYAHVAFTWRVVNHHLYLSQKLHVTGKFRVGHKLRAAYGTVRSDSTHGPRVAATVRYQWYANGRKIKGATHSTLKLKSKQRHKKVWVKISVIRRYYYGWTAWTGRKKVK